MPSIQFKAYEKLNICLFLQMASAFVPERTHAHNITHFDCQISLDISPLRGGESI